MCARLTRLRSAQCFECCTCVALRLLWLHCEPETAPWPRLAPQLLLLLAYCQALEEVREELGLDAVTSYNELAIPLTARLAERLGLPGAHAARPHALKCAAHAPAAVRLSCSCDCWRLLALALPPALRHIVLCAHRPALQATRRLRATWRATRAPRAASWRQPACRRPKTCSSTVRAAAHHAVWQLSLRLPAVRIIGQRVRRTVQQLLQRFAPHATTLSRARRAAPPPPAHSRGRHRGRCCARRLPGGHQAHCCGRIDGRGARGRAAAAQGQGGGDAETDGQPVHGRKGVPSWWLCSRRAL